MTCKARLISVSCSTAAYFRIYLCLSELNMQKVGVKEVEHKNEMNFYEFIYKPR